MAETSIRAVWPELPEHAEWLPYLEETRLQNWHTNFGPLVRRFEARASRALRAQDGSCRIRITMRHLPCLRV